MKLKEHSAISTSSTVTRKLGNKIESPRSSKQTILGHLESQNAEIDRENNATLARVREKLKYGS